MASIGSVFVAGRAADGGWALVPELEGVRIRALSTGLVTHATLAGAVGATAIAPTPELAPRSVLDTARLTRFRSVALGASHGLAVTDAGALYCWGAPRLAALPRKTCAAPCWGRGGGV
jgi:alpha-tubulin suppressor-like RCC1 family protein